MDMQKKNKPVKKKVLKKGSGNSQKVSPPPAILKKGTKNPSGVSVEEKIQMN